MTLSLLSSSEGATRSLGRSLGRALVPGLTVLMDGDLGTGKTVLVRGVGDALGVGERVRSPSFTLVNEYPASNGLLVVHADLYRLEDTASVEALGLEEYLLSPDTALIVEWPERWGSPPEDEVLSVRLRSLNEECRILIFSPAGSKAESVVNALGRALDSGECPGIERLEDNGDEDGLGGRGDE